MKLLSVMINLHNTAEIIEYYKNKFPNLNSINIKNTPNDWAGKMGII